MQALCRKGELKSKTMPANDLRELLPHDANPFPGKTSARGAHLSVAELPDDDRGVMAPKTETVTHHILPHYFVVFRFYSFVVLLAVM